MQQSDDDRVGKQVDVEEEVIVAGSSGGFNEHEGVGDEVVSEEVITEQVVKEIDVEVNDQVHDQVHDEVVEDVVEDVVEEVVEEVIIVNEEVVKEIDVEVNDEVNDEVVIVNEEVVDSDDDTRSIWSIAEYPMVRTASRWNLMSERVMGSILDLSNLAAGLQGKIRNRFPRASMVDLTVRNMSPAASSGRSSQRHSLDVGRYPVKNGYLIELQPDGQRKRRHVLLFTDFIACSKFTKLAELTGRQMVVKWFQHLSRVTVKTETASLEPIRSDAVYVTSLLSQAAELRNRIVRSPSDQLRKKLAAIEDKLLVAAVDLPLTLIVHTQSSRSMHVKTDTYTFLLASELERTMWIKAFHTLQNKINSRFAPKLQRSVVEYHIKSCPVEPFGRWISFNENVLLPKGELVVTVHSVEGLTKSANVFVGIEWDTYSHYLCKCRTGCVNSLEPRWGEQFTLQLDGVRGLRVLLYELNGKQSINYQGGAELKLTEQWLRSLDGLVTNVPLSQPWFISDVPYDPGELQFNLSFSYTPATGKYQFILIKCNYNNNIYNNLPTVSFVQFCSNYSKTAICFILKKFLFPFLFSYHSYQRINFQRFLRCAY